MNRKRVERNKPRGFLSLQHHSSFTVKYNNIVFKAIPTVIVNICQFVNFLQTIDL